MQASKAKSRTEESRLKLQQIQKLRVCVFVCLLLTSCLFAVGAYVLIDRFEEQSQHDLYETIVAEFRTFTIKSINDE